MWEQEVTRETENQTEIVLTSWHGENYFKMMIIPRSSNLLCMHPVSYATLSCLLRKELIHNTCLTEHQLCCGKWREIVLREITGRDDFLTYKDLSDLHLIILNANVDLMELLLELAKMLNIICSNKYV